MKALPPPKPNELDALREEPAEPAAEAPSRPAEPPLRPPTLDIAILQAMAADTAADTRALLREAMTAYGGQCDDAWLDAVLGVFELD